MFNKDKCKKCRYHSKYSGGLLVCKGGGELSIMCNYLAYAGETCLKMVDGKVVDTRGEDPDNCFKFEEGRPKKEVSGWR